MIITVPGGTYSYGNDGELEEVKLEAGSLVHFRGFPFRLKEDAVLLGRQKNMDIAKEQGNTQDSGE